MKLLIDECLSHRVARHLITDHGHDAVHVGDRQLLGHIDPEVMACACHEDRVLVSADTDFGELLARSHDALPSVVLLRREIHDAVDQASAIAQALELAADDLAIGAIVVIGDNRIRIRSLPLGGVPND